MTAGVIVRSYPQNIGISRRCQTHIGLLARAGMGGRVALCLLVWVMAFSARVFAAQLEVEAKVDRGTITIGDRIRYDIIVRYEEGVQPEPNIPGENLGEFEIKDFQIGEPKKDKDGRWVSRTTYIITTFTTGEFIIPPAVIKYRDAAGNEREASSREIKIKVKGVAKAPGDKDDIRPLKDAELMKAGHFLLYILLILLFLAVLGAGSYYFRRSRHREEAPPPPPRPPREVAIEELDRLKEKGLIQKGLIKEFYTEISDIIRKFLEGYYRVTALDRTTWELYYEMRKKRIKREVTDMVRNFLEECDLVKFAKYTPVPEEIENIIAKAYEIVNIDTADGGTPEAKDKT